MQSPTPAASPERTPLVVLVHGAWHGAWCWAALQAELDTRGIPSVALDLPGHGASSLPPADLSGDVAHTAQLLDRCAARPGGPIVLVGHSYGGAVISEAAAGRDDVAHLVYVAAFALLPGESVTSMARSGGHRVALGDAIVPVDDTTFELDPERAPVALYGECSDTVVRAAVARLDGQPMATFSREVANSALATTPSSYVICARDEAVHPEHQRMMAARCTTSVEIDTDHSPFLSAVGALADHLQQVVDDVADRGDTPDGERIGAPSTGAAAGPTTGSTT